MRVPHTISPNTYEVYRPSNVTVNLVAEKDRTLRSEDVEWDKTLPPSLVTICVEALVENFTTEQVLDELPNEDKDLLYETLPTDLELALTVPILVDDIYWQRSAQARWTSGNYVKDYGNSWKRLYLERYLQDHLETMMVEDYNLDAITALMKLCAHFVRRLTLRQLQLARPPPPTEWEGDECTIEPEPTEHINLEPVLRGLHFLQEIDLIFGVRECGMDFAWRMFKFSVRDCDQLGQGLNRCKHLKIFRIHRSTLDDIRLITLLHHLAKNKTLTELDFTHCHIADTGALAIGKLLTIHPTLAKVNLCNNKICAKGATGLAYALVQPGGCPLDSLSLRLNVIGEEGTIDLCSALAKCSRPRELNLAGCGITENAIIKIGQMLQQNKTLQHLDLTNNHLGETGGEALELGLKDNTTLLKLDLRMTQVAQEQEFAINAALQSNFAKWKRKQRRRLAAEGAEKAQDEDESTMYDSEEEEGEEGGNVGVGEKKEVGGGVEKKQIQPEIRRPSILAVAAREREVQPASPGAEGKEGGEENEEGAVIEGESDGGGEKKEEAQPESPPAAEV